MIKESLPWEKIFAKAKYGHRPDIKSGIEASLQEGREFAEQGIASDNADVLDLGCGVGVDTLIAAQYTDGLVYGIDPCENEVLLAREIALEKGLDPTRVKFC